MVMRQWCSENGGPVFGLGVLVGFVVLFVSMPLSFPPGLLLAGGLILVASVGFAVSFGIAERKSDGAMGERVVIGLLLLVLMSVCIPCGLLGVVAGVSGLRSEVVNDVATIEATTEKSRSDGFNTYRETTVRFKEAKFAGRNFDVPGSYKVVAGDTVAVRYRLLDGRIFDLRMLCP